MGRPVERHQSKKPAVQVKPLESGARGGDSPVAEGPQALQRCPEYPGTRETLGEFRRTTSEG